VKSGWCFRSKGRVAETQSTPGKFGTTFTMYRMLASTHNPNARQVITEFCQYFNLIVRNSAKFVKESTHNSCKGRRHAPNHLDTVVGNAQNLMAIQVGIGYRAVRCVSCLRDSTSKNRLVFLFSTIAYRRLLGRSKDIYSERPANSFWLPYPIVGAPLITAS
jgi:hypothetical protein